MSLPSTVPGVLGEASLDAFDVVVVGSGAGGATAARVLASSGLKVLVLEAGDNYLHGLDDPAGLRPPTFSNDELKLAIRTILEPDPLVAPRTFRHSEADGARTYVGSVQALPQTVGGGTIHADLKTPRYEATDFQLGTLLGPIDGANFADWPMTYDDLEPFYALAETLLGVQGEAGADPRASPRSGPYPMPPGVPMYVANVLASAANDLGYSPFAFPTAVASRPYRGRPPCNDCGFCSGFGCVSHAKGSAAVTFLRDALLTGNCQVRYRAPVLRFLSDGGQVTGVVYADTDGREVTVVADRYVLAASPIEDARLLLLSDLGGPGLGNSSGAVGRNLVFHFQTQAIGIFPQRFHGHRGRSVTHALTDFRGVPGDPDHPLGGIIELATSAEPIGEGMNYVSDLHQKGPMLAALLRDSPFRDRLAAMIMQAEDAPQLTNRVDLDPDIVDWRGQPVPRITYENHPWELAARAHYAPLLLQILQRAGAHYGLIAPADDPPDSDHIMGTLRMGLDPTTSVCDRWGRLHDLENLYCTDGALFPTASGYNPTLTIHAVALWVAGAMVYPEHPERILPG